MIRHVVMWKLRRQNKDENLGLFKEMLLSLEKEIDEIKSMSVGRDVMGSEWDMVLILDVESEEALKKYKEHPKHKIAAEFLKSIKTDTASVDFEI